MNNFDYDAYYREKQNNKHEKTKTTLKILGFIFLGIGIICVLVGFIDFLSMFVSFDYAYTFPQFFFLFFIGFPCISAGAIMLIFGFKRELLTYGKNEAVPVINQTATEVTPAIRTVVKTVNETANNNDELKNRRDEEKNFDVCPSCGHNNLKGSKFCSECGKPMKKTCPDCNAEVENTAHFCPNCGRKL